MHIVSTPPPSPTPHAPVRVWRSCRTLPMLLWIFAVHAAALYLFTTGFFLTRFEVPDLSECATLPAEQIPSSTGARFRDARDIKSTQQANDRENCWMRRRFRRVVFVVIDALRFDFVLSGSARRSMNPTSPSFYLNHLPILNATLHAQPAYSALFKFVADPPTMTMQRLKGLTTGSLPTFLDIKDNMASSAITEDNLIRQMHAQQRPIVFMGDDTWDALYQKYFTRRYSYDSFNVKDLHTVDRGVVEHLFPELQKPDWDLLIAHFLGVDHVGHTHGPSSPHMTEKLHEMNEMLTRLLRELPDNTLLLVMGDHGMSADGNHGGASDDETGAALFLHSKQLLVDSHTKLQWSQVVPQVDLVPTVALLSGLPIPFGSLGAVIPQLFFFTDAKLETNAMSARARADASSLKTLNEALRLNVNQVRRYLVAYSSASKLPESEYQQLQTLYDHIQSLEGRVREARASADVNSDDMVRLRLKLSKAQHAYVRDALVLGRSIWTQFDLVSMSWGLLLLLLAQALVAQILLGGEHGAITTACASWSLIIGAALGALCPTMAWLPRSNLSKIVLGTAISGSIDTMWRYRVTFVNEIATMHQFPTRATTGISSWIVAGVTVLLHILALLSNSYIVAEDKVMNFLTATIGVFMLWYAQRHAAPHRRELALGSALTFTLTSRLTSAVEPPNIIHSYATAERTWVPLVVLGAFFAAFVVKCRVALSRTGTGLLAVCVVACCFVACGSFWLFAPFATAFWRLWLPRAVFLALLLTIGSNMFQIAIGSAATSQLASEANAFQVRFFLMVPVLVLAYSLVLGPTSPLITVSILVQHLSFASVVYYGVPGHPAPLTWIVLWCAICSQSFFASGHQSTFTSLQNASGFVGFDEFHFYWAGALLGLNTFGNYALALACLPLLVLRPKTTPTELWHAWSRAVLTVVAYFALRALVSAVFVALQRRHLMVWAIFAPKFIFDGATLLVLELLALLTSLQMAGSIDHNL